MEILYPLSNNAPPSLQLLATTVLHHCDFAFTRMSYIWNHTVCNLFRLASFIWQYAFKVLPCLFRASQVALVVKKSPANAGGIRDMGSIPGSARSPGGGNGYPIQYSCLENPMDRAICSVHGIEKGHTRLSD